MNRREAIKNTALLGGASILTGSLFSILQSCKSEPRLSWKPIFLNADQAQLISALVDTVLPKTATPGGLDMKVDIFMDTVFAKLYNEEGQKALVADMDGFNEKCKSKFGKPFVELDKAQRIEILKAEEANSPKYVGKVWGTAVGEQQPVGFYRSMKSLMLWGYFSSEEIGMKVLNYDPVPGDYLGCIPMKDVGRVWSL
jgi:hypothetical protein